MSQHGVLALTPAVCNNRLYQVNSQFSANFFLISPEIILESSNQVY